MSHGSVLGSLLFKIHIRVLLHLFDLTNVGNYVDGTTFHAYDVDLEILIKD